MKWTKIYKLKKTKKIMKKLVFLFVSIFVLVLTAQNLKAQPEASDNGTATATILTPIEIDAVNELEFGSIAAGLSESYVKISTAGTRTRESGDVDLYSLDAGQQGTFDVTGAAEHTYAITLPSNGSVTITGDGDPMEVKDFESDPDETGTLNASGEETINVGATLVVGASQTAGTYSGTYQVTVNYN